MHYIFNAGKGNWIQSVKYIVRLYIVGRMYEVLWDGDSETMKSHSETMKSD
jgi:hypothetical protein